MASKRKKDEINFRLERIRLKKLAKEGRLANGVEMPPGALPADLSQQAPNNSYSPPLFYRDIDFKCANCGAEEVWKAKDQKWYFEVVKGPVQSQPKRCRECRKKIREMKAAQRVQMQAADLLRRQCEKKTE